MFCAPTRRIPASVPLDISTLPRPHMVRTNSHSFAGLIILKSAKRFARTAPLHEVRGSLEERANANGRMTATCSASVLSGHSTIRSVSRVGDDRFSRLISHVRRWT
ncbi:hypothetical protein K503DRAFT_510428 [Rhizopogon vinicolor AM-OR11-026]|uniref:Uncharacterized protein n=1 Tax=Rhizopogon vinicolor AM-OR11-026 TaxID=1314800 RepID=A0A1B7MLX0_9AGAM|nr:hypothetical protein K503DRAFT_510428 [Rhizopogon vinicolor AM-OR11-026]